MINITKKSNSDIKFKQVDNRTINKSSEISK